MKRRNPEVRTERTNRSGGYGREKENNVSCNIFSIIKKENEITDVYRNE